MTRIMFLLPILLILILLSISLLSKRRALPSDAEGSTSYTDEQVPSGAAKISTRPRLLGLERGVVSEDELYFDEEYLYASRGEGQVASHRLSDITSLSMTDVVLNNRRIWEIRVRQDDGGEVVLRFAHNFTLWNWNFRHFYGRMKELNPGAVRTEWSIWSM